MVSHYGKPHALLTLIQITSYSPVSPTHVLMQPHQSLSSPSYLTHLPNEYFAPLTAVASVRFVLFKMSRACVGRFSQQQRVLAITHSSATKKWEGPACGILVLLSHFDTERTAKRSTYYVRRSSIKY
jgi:hypothetical protein